MHATATRRLGIVTGLVLVYLTLTGAVLSVVDAPAHSSYASGDFFFPPYPSDTDRLGVAGSIAYYTSTLNAGWYADWGANPDPPHPGGIEYARTIYFGVNTPVTLCGSYKRPASLRSEVDESITGTALIDNLHANPGALWLIGNEPDSIYNGSPILPELYAELYHEFYTFIKMHDPAARVAIGAIVQPSPLRLEYLDKVLNRYQTLYGQKLPADSWNIHLYIFNEGQCFEWGAAVPPGSSAPGWVVPFSASALLNVDVMHTNLVTFRQWMADRGYRDRPLIITEFGVLPPPGYHGFEEPVTAQFLTDMFNMLRTATHAAVGYVADGNRLVQLWAWYSLYDSQYGGDLLADTAGSALTPAGAAFAQIAAAAYAPTLDLYPEPLITPTLPVGGGDPITVTLTAQVDNRGNSPVTSVPVRFAQYDVASGALLTGVDITLGPVFARYAGTQPQVSAEWSIMPGAQRILTFEIDPGRTISQTRRSAQMLAYPGAPDLVVAALAGSVPPAFLWRSPLTSMVTATVHNGGNVTSAPGLVLFDWVGPGGAIQHSSPVPPLAAGSSADATATLAIAAPGRYILSATIQYTGLEWNSQNNTVTRSILAALTQMVLPIVLR